jgi:hypothetical protein
VSGRSGEITFPSRDLERHSRAASDCEDRCAVNGRTRASDKIRVAHEHQHASGCVNHLSTNGEDGVPAHHREQLLMAIGSIEFVVALVMRLYQLVARVPVIPFTPNARMSK